jgi:hypothetical protein
MNRSGPITGSSAPWSQAMRGTKGTVRTTTLSSPWRQRSLDGATGLFAGHPATVSSVASQVILSRAVGYALYVGDRTEARAFNEWPSVIWLSWEEICPLCCQPNVSSPDRWNASAKTSAG